MSNIIKFYTNVVESMGANVDEEGFIKIGRKPITVKNKSLVMPIRSIMANLQKVDESGKMINKFSVFNPMKENLVRGDSDSLNKLKQMVDMNLSKQVSFIGELLLKLASRENVKNIPMSIMDFLTTLETARSANIKKLVDDDVISKWTDITAKAIRSKNPPVKTFLKKGVVIEGEKHNRGLVVDFPLLEPIEKGDVHVTLRPKEKKLYKLVFNFIIGDLIDDNVISTSDDVTSPGIMALLKGYKKLVDRFNKLLETLKFVDEELVDLIIIDLKYDYDDLVHVSKLKSELASIPDVESGDLMESSDASNNAPRTRADILNSGMRDTVPVDVNNVSNNVVNDSIDDEDAIINKILYGDNRQQMQYAQPQQQQYVQQPQYVQPQQQQYVQQPQQQQYVQPQQQQQYVQQPQQQYVQPQQQQQYVQQQQGGMSQYNSNGIPVYQNQQNNNTQELDAFGRPVNYHNNGSSLTTPF